MTVYKAVYNPNIYESAYTTLSIHLTKENAEKAISEHKSDKKREWEYLYNDDEEPYKFGELEDWLVIETEIEK